MTERFSILKLIGMQICQNLLPKHNWSECAV